MAVTYIGFFIGCGFTTLAMIWLGRETLSDASGILIIMLGGGAAQATTYTYNRTQEKLTQSEEVPEEVDD